MRHFLDGGGWTDRTSAGMARLAVSGRVPYLSANPPTKKPRGRARWTAADPALGDNRRPAGHSGGSGRDAVAESIAGSLGCPRPAEVVHQAAPRLAGGTART